MKRNDIIKGKIFTFQGVKHEILKVNHTKDTVKIKVIEGRFINELQTLPINSLLYSLNRA